MTQEEFKIGLKDIKRPLKKLQLLKDVCIHYDYSLKIKNGKVICDNGRKSFEYDTVDNMLKYGWLPTMLESNEEEEKEFYLWSKADIELCLLPEYKYH